MPRKMAIVGMTVMAIVGMTVLTSLIDFHEISSDLMIVVPN